MRRTRFSILYPPVLCDLENVCHVYLCTTTQEYTSAPKYTHSNKVRYNDYLSPWLRCARPPLSIIYAKAALCRRKAHQAPLSRKQDQQRIERLHLPEYLCPERGVIKLRVFAQQRATSGM
jgi:hypothetical protein